MDTCFETPPFLKWAGGKRWFCENYINDFIPQNYNRYIEPFLGSGAVFFSLKPKKSILNDLNSDLILTYKAIRDNYTKIESILKLHDKKHKLDPDYYYKVRASNPILPETKAAKFIYLNRTCFNGLYRVNLNGKFNVPKGTKKNVVLDTDNFKNISKALKSTKFFNRDFEEIIDLSKEGDLLFVDPPYTVRHNNNGFLKYNENIFTWEDQKRLMRSLVRAKSRGVHVICTNADHSSIRNLYRGEFRSKSVTRNSVIAAKNTYRETVKERVFYS